MLLNKKLIAISIAVMLAFSGALTVLAADKQTVKVTSAKQKVQAKKHAKIIATASKLGIDTSGLTDKEISTKVNAALHQKKHDRLLATTKSLGIDTTGLTDKDINTKINTAMQIKRHTQLLAQAAKLGIDTIGLSDKEIIKKVNVAKLKDKKQVKPK